MKNIEQRVCGRRIYTFLVVCLVALMNLSGYASVKVHVQYLTTADGLSNNSGPLYLSGIAKALFG